MGKFHTLKILRVEKLTPDSVAISFDIPEDLRPNYSFTPGQHVIVKIKTGGKFARRTYSLCNAPGEDLRIGVRRMQNGQVSIYLNESVKPGDELEVSEPHGDFSLQKGKNFAAIVTGSGLTPILSMIRTVLSRDTHSRFTLAYGNQDRAHTMFFDELCNLKDKYPTRFSFDMFLSRQAVDIDFLAGRIDAEKIRRLHKTVYTPMAIEHYYLCGHKDMVETAAKTLTELGVSGDQIHSELFFTGKPQPITSNTKAAKAELTIINDGRKTTIAYSGEHGSILETALAAGLDVSHSCKGGVCATCRAKLIAGEVRQGKIYGLEDDEIEAGFILTCQSTPKSKKLTLSFDE